MLKQSFIYLFLTLIFFGCTQTEKPTSEQTAIVDELTELNASILKDSTNATLYNKRAKIYLGKSQLDKALIDINKALYFDSKDAEIFLTLAEIYFVMSKPDNCNVALVKAAEIDPQNPKPFVKLAELNLALENYNNALAYTDKAFQISNFNPEAYYVRGMVFLAKKDTVSAIKNIQLALDQKDDFYEPMMQLGTIYSNQRNPLAEDYLLRILKSYPESVQARYQLALYLQDNERIEDAITQYDTLLNLVPHSKIVKFNLGYIQLVYLNDFLKAIYYFDEALAIDPNYIDALFNKGHALEELGRFVNARDIYNEVLRREPNYELAIKALNRLDRRK